MGNGFISFFFFIGIVVSFDLFLQVEVVGVLVKELKSWGVRRVFVLVVNFMCDLCWGWINEIYGEDFYLSGQMGVVYVWVMEKVGFFIMIKYFVANMGLDG